MQVVDVWYHKALEQSDKTSTASGMRSASITTLLQIDAIAGRTAWAVKRDRDGGKIGGVFFLFHLDP